MGTLRLLEVCKVDLAVDEAEGVADDMAVGIKPVDADSVSLKLPGLRAQDVVVLALPARAGSEVGPGATFGNRIPVPLRQWANGINGVINYCIWQYPGPNDSRHGLNAR